jgi:hypothetical protein
MNLVSAADADNVARCRSFLSTKASFDYFVSRKHRSYLRFLRITDELIRSRDLPKGISSILDVFLTANFYAIWWEAARRHDYICSRTIGESGIVLSFRPQIKISD